MKSLASAARRKVHMNCGARRFSPWRKKSLAPDECQPRPELAGLPGASPGTHRAGFVSSAEESGQFELPCNKLLPGCVSNNRSKTRGRLTFAARLRPIEEAQ